MLHLDSDEIVVMEIRKHWFVLFSHGLLLFFLAIIPIPICLFLSASESIILGKVIVENITSFILFFYSLWLLILWVTFFFRWTDYFLDVWYVTDKRVIDVEQKGLFHRDVSTLYYENIRDITIKTYGIIPTFLNFGDIHMQTSGENREFIMLAAANPSRAKEIILNQYQKNEAEPKTVRLES